MFSEYSIDQQILWYVSTTKRWRKGRIVKIEKDHVVILTRPEKYKLEITIDDPSRLKSYN